MNQNEITEIENTIKQFVNNQECFTALDISNKVKDTFPRIRHSDVRNFVADAFSIMIGPNGYVKTSIEVSLIDDTKARAICYHPISDSWDLDVKYDDSKRKQSSVMKIPTSPTPAFNPLVQTAPQPAQSNQPNYQLWYSLLTQNNMFKSV